MRDHNYPNEMYLDLARNHVQELVAEVERLQAEVTAVTQQRDALVAALTGEGYRVDAVLGSGG